jgi:hypothetical protein
MKTKNELKAIVNKWWVYNQTASQVGEAKYFVEQLGDWESNFTEFQKDGYQTPEGDWDLERAKDVKGGISFRLSSGTNVIDGILDMSSGTITLKDLGEVNTTGSLVFRGAGMDV